VSGGMLCSIDILQKHCSGSCPPSRERPAHNAKVESSICFKTDPYDDPIPLDWVIGCDTLHGPQSTGSPFCATLHTQGESKACKFIVLRCIWHSPERSCTQKELR
jgi:hypothetical protein